MHADRAAQPDRSLSTTSSTGVSVGSPLGSISPGVCGAGRAGGGPGHACENAAVQQVADYHRVQLCNGQGAVVRVRARGVKLLAGREFGAQESTGSPLDAIVTEGARTELFRGRIGARAERETMRLHAETVCVYKSFIYNDLICRESVWDDLRNWLIRGA